MKRFFVTMLLAGVAGLTLQAQPYVPMDRAFVCENGSNRFTRALYGSHTGYRIETSDRPIFALVKKGHMKSLRFEVAGVPLEQTDYCWTSYESGIRKYVLQDKRLAAVGIPVLRVNVVARHDEEGAVWEFIADKYPDALHVSYKLCDVANPKLKRNGDLGVDARESFDPAPGDAGLKQGECTWACNFAHLVMRVDEVLSVSDVSAYEIYSDAVAYNRRLASRIEFNTPDPYINTLGGALVMAADGDWDGQTWLHGCIGWRMPLAGWRAGFIGDFLGWNDRAVSHFNAYAKSQVTDVEPTIAHPSQDPEQNMARAEKKWGTQMYSNGYICRNPERNDQMHHYDMNLNYIDELLWHFQFDADPDYMRQMWPVIKRHLEWEKRNYDPDGDHLYDAYCCIWASDALYYSGGAVTHSSAYNYRANLLAARIAQLIGEDAAPYQAEAEAILEAMNQRLWLDDKGHWAEYQDALGHKRLHKSAALWSVYTPIDCGACTPEQAYRATLYVDNEIPHISVGDTQYQTVATSNWQPYEWSVNNVAAAEVMHTALAYFQAGRHNDAYRLMMANVMDQMYLGQSPANFGQLSRYDAARGECYRDFGDCIGISARTLLQGLFGIQPRALYGECILRPGFPEYWEQASVKTPYLEYKFTRIGNTDRYEVTQNFRQPLKIIVRVNLGGGRYTDVEGTAEHHQVINFEHTESEYLGTATSYEREVDLSVVTSLQEPQKGRAFKEQDIDSYFNANVTDIFRNSYVSPRPQTTTLQIPLQGAGDWCHPKYTPDIDDSGFRQMASGNRCVVAGVPFRTPQSGRNIVYTSLWDNYPDAIEIPLKGKARMLYLLMAGSTNHMQSRIDNGLVVVTYMNGRSDTLALRNPDNWCPIDKDYYVDQQAFKVQQPRPYRVSLSTGQCSRDLGETLGLSGVDGRTIPGGAAQLLCVPLEPKKKLKRLKVETLSNDVVIGLMGVTLQ